MEVNLPWDGSFLGEINKDNIIDDRPHPTLRGRLWTLRFSITGQNREIIVRCYRRRIENSYPSIVDEIKPLFKLRKVGTHRVQLGSGIYLIQRIDRIRLDLTLDRYLPTPENRNPFRVEVQDLFAFRDAMCLASNYENTIHLAQSGSLIYPISFTETSPAFGSKRDRIPQKIFKKWFGETTLTMAYQRLFGLDRPEPGILQKRIAEIRSQIESVILRVDRQMITYGYLIVERITERIPDLETEKIEKLK